MNELNNLVTAVGNYNSVPTSLTSNTSVVNMIEGLTITKTADKTNWIDGNLTYTIVIDNKADQTYENPVVTDVIDTNLVEFVNDSVMIDGVKATTSQYNYNTANHTLTINLNNITPSSSSTLKFQVTKKV